MRTANGYFIQMCTKTFKQEGWWTMSLPASKSKPTSTDAAFQQSVVQLIAIAKRPEDALDLLSEYYGVERPRLRMGLPSGEKRALGCYVHRDKTIYISSQEYLYDPYVLIHEFYHHLRHVGGKHRGTEKHARDFALAFLSTATNSAFLKNPADRA